METLKQCPKDADMTMNKDQCRTYGEEKKHLCTRVKYHSNACHTHDAYGRCLAAWK